MAQQFSYANLPRHRDQSENPYMTDLMKQRMGYWGGERQGKIMDLNQLWDQRFQNLQTLKSQDFQSMIEQEQKANELGSSFRGMIKKGMGGDRLLQSDEDKSLWRDPTQHKWWDNLPGTSNFADELIASGDFTAADFATLNQGKGIPTQKWLTPEDMIRSSDFSGTSSFQMNKSGTMVLNPNWKSGVNTWLQNFSNKAAQSGLGKLGS